MRKSLKELEQMGLIKIEWEQPFCKKCGQDFNYFRSVDKKKALCECGISALESREKNLLKVVKK